MSAIVPFNFAAPATHVSKKRENSANALFLAANAPSFPQLAIKGKVWTMVKGDTRKVLTRTVTNDDGSTEQIPLASISLAVIAGNPKARTFYAKGFVEGDEQGQKPTCFTHDGIRPDAQAAEPQCKTCAACPKAAWGSKVRTDDGEAKGTACSPRIRLAVTDPSKPALAFRLDVPPGSASNWRGAVALIENHDKDFFEVAFKVSFDVEAATPKLVFQPVGFLSDDALQAVKALQNDTVVADILGVPSPRPEGDEAPAEQPKAETPKAEPKPEPKPKAVVSTDELDGALSGGLADVAATAAKAATQKAKAKAETPKADPKPAAKPAVTVDAGDADGLLGDLQGLLNNKDD